MMLIAPPVAYQASTSVRSVPDNVRTQRRSRRRTRRSGSGQRVGRNARVLERLVGDLEQQPLLRVHPGGLAGHDLEVLGVERVDVGQERTPPGGAGQRRAARWCRRRTTPSARAGTSPTDERPSVRKSQNASGPAMSASRPPGSGNPDRSPRSARPSSPTGRSRRVGRRVPTSPPVRNFGERVDRSGTARNPPATRAGRGIPTAHRTARPHRVIPRRDRASKRRGRCRSGLQPIFVTR